MSYKVNFNSYVKELYVRTNSKMLYAKFVIGACEKKKKKKDFHLIAFTQTRESQYNSRKEAETCFYSLQLIDDTHIA